MIQKTLKKFLIILEGLFVEGDGLDEKYERDVICNFFKSSYIYFLMEDIKDRQDKKLYPYMEHHNKCDIDIAKQFSENFKITKC